MLRAGILVLVTGCRGLLGIEEAEIVDASDAPDVDANGDGSLIDSSTPGDAAPVTCSPAVALSDTTLAVDGRWFTADPGSNRATKLDTVSASISGVEGNINQSASAYAVIVPATGIVYSAPRLSPGGSELYAVRDVGGSLSLIRVTRSGVLSWSSPQTVSFGTGLTAGDVPSTVSSTNPRRMIISRSTRFDEYIEQTANSWQQESSALPAFGPTFLGEVMLSPDGLRMVFRGQLGASTFGAFVVSRPNLSVQFSGTATRLPTGAGNVNVSSPFLTGDCKHLYFTDATSGLLHHVSYP